MSSGHPAHMNTPSGSDKVDAPATTDKHASATSPSLSTLPSASRDSHLPTPTSSEQAEDPLPPRTNAIGASGSVAGPEVPRTFPPSDASENFRNASSVMDTRIEGSIAGDNTVNDREGDATDMAPVEQLPSNGSVIVAHASSVQSDQAARGHDVSLSAELLPVVPFDGPPVQENGLISPPPSPRRLRPRELPDVDLYEEPGVEYEDAGYGMRQLDMAVQVCCLSSQFPLPAHHGSIPCRRVHLYLSKAP